MEAEDIMLAAEEEAIAVGEGIAAADKEDTDHSGTRNGEKHRLLF